MSLGRVVEPTAATARSLAERWRSAPRASGAVATNPPLAKVPREHAKSAGLVQAAEPVGTAPVLALITDAPPALPDEALSGIGDGEALSMGTAGVAPIYRPAPDFFGGGGSGGGGGGGGGGVVTPPPTGAVPDPATWLTMPVGFGTHGVGLRRDRKARRALAADGDGHEAGVTGPDGWSSDG